MNHSHDRTANCRVESRLERFTERFYVRDGEHQDDFTELSLGSVDRGCSGVEIGVTSVGRSIRIDTVWNHFSI